MLLSQSQIEEMRGRMHSDGLRRGLSALFSMKLREGDQLLDHSFKAVRAVRAKLRFQSDQSQNQSQIVSKSLFYLFYQSFYANKLLGLSVHISHNPDLQKVVLRLSAEFGLSVRSEGGQIVVQGREEQVRIRGECVNKQLLRLQEIDRTLRGPCLANSIRHFSQNSQQFKEFLIKLRNLGASRVSRTQFLHSTLDPQRLLHQLATRAYAVVKELAAVDQQQFRLQVKEEQVSRVKQQEAEMEEQFQVLSQRLFVERSLFESQISEAKSNAQYQFNLIIPIAYRTLQWFDNLNRKTFLYQLPPPRRNIFIRFLKVVEEVQGRIQLPACGDLYYLKQLHKRLKKANLLCNQQLSYLQQYLRVSIQVGQETQPLKHIIRQRQEIYKHKNQALIARHSLLSKEIRELRAVIAEDQAKLSYKSLQLEKVQSRYEWICQRIKEFQSRLDHSVVLKVMVLNLLEMQIDQGDCSLVKSTMPRLQALLRQAQTIRSLTHLVRQRKSILQVTPLFQSLVNEHLI